MTALSSSATAAATAAAATSAETTTATAERSLYTGSGYTGSGYTGSGYTGSGYTDPGRDRGAPYHGLYGPCSDHRSRCPAANVLRQGRHLLARGPFALGNRALFFYLRHTCDLLLDLRHACYLLLNLGQTG